MPSFFDIVVRVIAFVLAMLFDSRFWILGAEEWFGFLGACAWTVLSFGRIDLENLDKRAIFSGAVIVYGGLGLIAWFFFVRHTAVPAT